jgi:hypothetical protein
MPAVVTYWQLPDDEKEFLDFLLSTGSILAVPSHWVEAKEELVPQPIASFIEHYDPDQLLFGLEEYVLRPAIERREFDRKLLFGVPCMKPCLITYSRGKLRNGKLPQSNLSAYLDYPSEGASKLLRKEQDFVRWVKKVMGWVRKFTPEQAECNGYPYRATKRVSNAICEGKLEVVLY